MKNEGRVRNFDVCLIGVSETETGRNGGEVIFKGKVAILGLGWQDPGLGR